MSAGEFLTASAAAKLFGVGSPLGIPCTLVLAVDDDLLAAFARPDAAEGRAS